MEKFHIISGLPRSGSTLLSAILNQNPRFHAGISDPLFLQLATVANSINEVVGSSAYISEDKLLNMQRGLIKEFYSDVSEPVVFNTNRAWCTNIPLMRNLYPSSRMIVCFRDVHNILDSFERLHLKNPHTPKPWLRDSAPPDIFVRSQLLFEGDNDSKGIVLKTLEYFQQATMVASPQDTLFIHYDALACHPEQVLDIVYDFLGEEKFDHNLDDVNASYPEYDLLVGAKDMHTVSGKVEYREPKYVLPITLLRHYHKHCFWLDPEFQKIKEQLNWLELINKEDVNPNSEESIDEKRD